MSDTEDRRKKDLDHDLLIRIDGNLVNFLEDFKAHKAKFEQHVQDDTNQFSRINRFMWMILGGAVTVQLGFKLLVLFKN